MFAPFYTPPFSPYVYIHIIRTYLHDVRAYNYIDNNEIGRSRHIFSVEQTIPEYIVLMYVTRGKPFSSHTPTPPSPSPHTYHIYSSDFLWYKHEDQNSYTETHTNPPFRRPSSHNTCRTLITSFYWVYAEWLWDELLYGKTQKMRRTVVVIWLSQGS